MLRHRKHWGIFFKFLFCYRSRIFSAIFDQGFFVRHGGTITDLEIIAEQQPKLFETHFGSDADRLKEIIGKIHQSDASLSAKNIEVLMNEFMPYLREQVYSKGSILLDNKTPNFWRENAKAFFSQQNVLF